MSENNITQKPKASAKTTAKKRTLYQERGLLALPEWAKTDKEHKYRWVSKRKTSRSDGFDPRGWSIAKNPNTGETLEAYDTVLYRMPIDEWAEMKSYKDEQARDSIKTVLENIESQTDRLRYEVEKLGGKIIQDFSIERKSS